jgi:hypothetical protein
VNMEQDHGDPDDEAVDEQESKAKKRRIRAASRNTALLVIVRTDTPDFRYGYPPEHVLSRKLLFPSVFFYRVPMSDVITFKVSLVSSSTRHQSPKKPSRRLHMPACQ